MSREGRSGLGVQERGTGQCATKEQRRWDDVQAGNAEGLEEKVGVSDAPEEGRSR